MERSTYDATIVVPVFNELGNIGRLIQSLDEFLDASPRPFKVLFVDDGSNDGSFENLQKGTEGKKSYSILQLERNYGLSTALKVGIDVCDTELFGYIDADNQTDPMDLLNFLGYFPAYDMVCGIRRHRNDSLVKKISSKVANKVRRIFIADNIEDSCCPLKLVKTSTLRKVPYFEGMHRFLPTLVQLAGGKVLQIPVRHYERYSGESKYNLSNRLIGPVLDTMAVRWMQSRYINYRLADQTLCSIPSPSGSA